MSITMCVSLAFGVPARLADQTKASMSGLVGVVTPSDLGAGERIRTADLPFTRSTAPCNERASCTDGASHRTDGIRCAGIIRRVVPRTVPRGRRETGPWL